ncbi:MAG: phage terminase large subunit [Micavibrio sp.]
MQESCNKHDFGVFLALWNARQNTATPLLHYRIATWLQRCWEHGETRLALQAFRGSGKSTLAGLFSAWLLWRDPDLRILVLAAESSLAQKMTRTIRKVIERHPLTRDLLPKHKDTHWATGSFTVRRRMVSRDPSVLARGITANSTGARADIIICDDVEVPNTCDTAEKRASLRERLLENSFILVPGGTQLYLGTPHSYDSIYLGTPRAELGQEKIFLEDYCRLTIPALDDAGKSAWPERFPVEKLEEIKRQAGPMKFESQMMLRPVNITESRLDPSMLRRYDDALCYEEIQQNAVLKIGGRKILSASAWWDPAFGKAGGDKSVLAIVYTDEDGAQRLHRVLYIAPDMMGRGQMRCGSDLPPDGAPYGTSYGTRAVAAGEDGFAGMEDKAGAQCRIVAQAARDFYLPSIAVETNGIGKFLPAILRRELAAMGVPASVLEKTSRQAKAERILESFDVVMAARTLHVHESVYQTPFIREMIEWRPALSSAQDDGLDAAAGALSLEPVRIPKTYAPKGRAWSAGAGAHRAKTDFAVID